MFASQWALLHTQSIRPASRPHRSSKRVRNHELSPESISSQNTLRWFSQSRLCSSLLSNRAEVERVLSHTPVFREELTVRNACAWPATFDSKHIGPFGPWYLRNTLEGIARGGVISRGFKTRSSSTRESVRNKDFLRQTDDGTSARPSTKSRFLELVDGKHITPEEKIRLTYAFAEGYRASDGQQKKFFDAKAIAQRLAEYLILGLCFYLFYVLAAKGFPMLGSANEISPEEIEVSFEDVMGVQEAKQELQEIVEFLKDPKKFSHLGGRLPKGALLVGPPGTGKTLLARAVAGEAGVPFFHASGSEFDEVLVGQGARRVRDLFTAAKERAPCVIFIDEIDSVGGKRSDSTLHPYANQTINQLLAEMDGFRQNEGVIVLGATNRRDHLDKALLRPGRFDVEVQVPRPDISGRKNLIDYYISKVKVDQKVDVDYLARGTVGFTGADIENMVNQAALRAAIDGKDCVTQDYIENARDKLLMGPEQRSQIPDQEDNLITAYHEGGHALVSYYSKGAMPIHKVTIIARGASLGHTAYIPSKDEKHLSKSQILARMDAMLGGRAAEELTFGVEKVTTGASSDLEQATNLATNMVRSWGMSDKVGERAFEVQSKLSNQMADLIDQEIKKTLHDSMERAKLILRTHERELKLLAEALLKYETLDGKEIKQLLETGSFSR